MMKRAMTYMGRKGLLILLSCLLCLLAFTVLSLISGGFTDALDHQKGAERWQGESEDSYAMVSAFFAPDKGPVLEDMAAIRAGIEKKLLEASLKAEENTRLWFDAYSRETDSAASRLALSYPVRLVGVGGDFFLIHSLRLLSGGYISDESPMNDYVVIDDYVAWNIFGSYDCVGMDFTMQGKTYYVAGVVERESGRANELGMGDKGRVYAQLDQLPEGTGISSYEAVLPELVSGFALGCINDSISSAYEYVSLKNTGRFSLLEQFKSLKGFSSRSIREDEVVYPYWENAARVTGDWLAILLVFKIIFLALPLIVLLVFLRRLWRRRKWRVKNVLVFFEQINEKRKTAAYEKMLAEKEAEKLNGIGAGGGKGELRPAIEAAEQIPALNTEMNETDAVEEKVKK